MIAGLGLAGPVEVGGGSVVCGLMAGLWSSVDGGGGDPAVALGNETVSLMLWLLLGRLMASWTL